jgi:hypothetical protein
MVVGQFDARGHIINDGLSDDGIPLGLVYQEARLRKQLKYQLIKMCAANGGHQYKERTIPYKRLDRKGNWLPDGNWHIFTCDCGDEKVVQDLFLDRENII